MIRSTTNRLQALHEIGTQFKRPVRYALGAPQHEINHYMVHQAACWLYELTEADAKLKGHMRAFDTLMKPAVLARVAQELMDHLYKHSGHFSSAVYASIWFHIKQGLQPPKE